MKKNNNRNIPMELSYYRLTLLSYLKESHPNLAYDNGFITTRSDEASEAYSNAIKDGLSHPEAEELANTTLFRDLLFSRYDTIINVLWNEFSDIIPQSRAKEYAERILSQCELIFLQYTLSDEFTDSPEYNTLYTELTGFISLWLEENEL
ncbi:DUF1896 domain-containing protein [Prevotella sp. 10(H)]|uniref:DUF1896 domain-containing protein n=1 Tax=Prevotella sp. 10(H) TaxID=1158294 RepID=UPI0004A75D09|nr:DUF1896 domain-containing protein [Prevotella sp. 10(H)]